MGAIDPRNYSKINPKKFTFVVHDKATIEAMGKSQKRFTVHIEIETGMNRHGVKPKDLNNFIRQIKKYPNITIEGVMSHLADADNQLSIAKNNESACPRVNVALVFVAVAPDDGLLKQEEEESAGQYGSGDCGC